MQPILILEAGLNHFGEIDEAKKILSFFIKSRFNHLTFMLHKKEFYNTQIKEKKANFYLPKSFYINALKLAHSKGKKIGLSVCDLSTLEDLSELNFDFYKILGIAINNIPLLKKIKSKKKDTYISLAIADDAKIKKCLKYISGKKKISLIYTSMSYDAKDTNLSRIAYLKKKYNIPVGYGHHFNNLNPVLMSSFYNPDFYFFYLKRKIKNKRIIYPDNGHAIFFDDLSYLNELINESIILANNKRISTSIKLKYGQ